VPPVNAVGKSAPIAGERRHSLGAPKPADPEVPYPSRQLAGECCADDFERWERDGYLSANLLETEDGADQAPALARLGGAIVRPQRDRTGEVLGHGGQS
jgi:hypothetical protein